MTTAKPSAIPADIAPSDASARYPLLLLIGSAVVWLLLSGVLALINTIQLHTPSFLANCPGLTFGRAQALQETAFIYGWAANAGLAVGLWVLARLGGAPLRALNWTVVGTLFWNTGIALGLVGIATGDATSVSFLQFPRYVQPLLLVAYGAISVAGVLAWTGRRSDSTFASQWYAVAALFLFPWLFSAAQVMLFWAPVRGVLQSVVSGWYVQGVWSLWLTPLALSGAYYLVPKITGRVLPSYDFASQGFWTLIVVGAWTGGRHLIGGPVPVWISSMAIVACCMALYHYFIIFLNLRGAFSGECGLGLVRFGLLAYILTGLLDAISASRGVAAIVQFTYFAQAQQHLALYGAITSLFFGALYYLAPRITGQAWASSALTRGHVTLLMLGISLLVLSLAQGGLVQAHALADSKVSFSELALQTRPWLLTATAAQGILFLANILFVVNFLQTFARTLKSDGYCPFDCCSSSTVEASAK